ncbi:MAG: hypothetical protein LQ339_008465 [Xanthoria mediterranea]|nr:MAG: hypothetical protein LQ339_008465 [Xanthoria mediterranea]
MERNGASNDTAVQGLTISIFSIHCTNVKKYYNYSDVVYSLALGFTKISIILLVLRIFCPKQKDPFYWILQSLNIFNTIFYAVFFFIPILLCRPREKAWLPKAPGRCLNIFGLYIASAVFNTVSDMAMYLVPLWKVWHLQISKDRKLGISAIFATGSLIFRLVFSVRFLLTPDYAYVKVQAICFTLAELAFGLICSCIFVLPRLYRHMASMPPYKSEEYQLRKYKGTVAPGSTSVQGGDGDNVHPDLKREQEQRNPWEHDVEAPVFPDTTRQFRAGIDAGWQKMRD